MAKKEPSNNHRTWVALESLYTAIYRERVSRANKINLEARESEFDMFHTIWSGTADLAHHIGSDFMKQVEGPILDLLSGLSGCSLVAASNNLLDFASEWTRKGDRNADHDKITATMEKLSYQAVSRLAYSDTPALAQDLIQRAIIEFPAASSWHRQFLSLRYMKDLPARDAKTMLLSFASAIGEKLEEQSYVKIGEAELPKGAPPASVVKVSTVKYLAQLLNNSEFIAPEPSIEVLIELFKGGTHIDIRIATLDSLLSTLNTILNETAEEWSSNPTIRKIINTLEIIIPIAGNINERRPVSDSDWAEAEENTEVPCTSSDEFTIPPLLGAILNIVKGEKYPNLKYLKWELFVRLVLPILKLSQEQHHTWFSLFLAKHGTTLDADRLPAIPITPLVWYQLLDYHSDLVPSVVIDQYNQYALLLLRMPKDIQEFNEALQRDTTLRNDPNVNHWLSIFCETGTLDFFGRNMRYRLLELIFSPHRAVAEKTDLLDVVVSQASALLDDYERRADEWHHLVANLKPRRTWQPADDYDSAHSKENWTSWHDWSNTLSLRLITLLEGKTVSEEGFALPSTFPLRLWGVPYPEPRAIEHDSNANFHLATHLDSTLSSFLESREGDALLWATLAEDVYNTLHVVYLTGLEPAEISTVVRLRIAIHVGDLNVDGQSVAPAVQLIKVAVTLKFVDSITKPTIPQKPKTQELPPDQVLTGDLIKRLHAVMNSWMQGGAKGSGVSAGVRNMAVKWKSENQAVWKNICSWDST
ncbi:hypothetical protein NPX13_g6327 [Xylaria arbuscula]|uniref:Uncharacterized protein n=1 Tax=Xylaria arbuscula TaxID=114810 RepID=A0A9W8NCE5_9PEZI|nr:hypothetical protein NPX13_g6327 [Xylaria arbuscula]